MYAWVLIFWMLSNSQSTVPGIASEAECRRVAHELGQQEHGIFGPKYECHRYLVAK